MIIITAFTVIDNNGNYVNTFPIIIEFCKWKQFALLAIINFLSCLFGHHR